jgi:glycine/D-amino acid oxidase-like deaminating enzyme
MKSEYRVVVVGGGVVGASALYHLAKFGWTDVALVEREWADAGVELTAPVVGVERGARRGDPSSPAARQPCVSGTP